MLQDRINLIKVPDIESKTDERMYVKDNDFTLIEPADHFKFINDAADNCFKVELDKLSARFTTKNFHAHYGIFGAYGTAEMAIGDTKLVTGYRLITQTLADGRVVPAIESCGYDFSSFDKKDLSFNVHGSFWDGFIDMFKAAYEGKIVDAIKGIMQKELTQTLPADFNKMIADAEGFIHIKPEWWLDIAQKEAGQVTNTSIELGVLGIMFDHR